MTDLTGKIAFIENTPQSGLPYINGEYFIIRDTPMTLYGIRLDNVGDHQTAETRPFTKKDIVVAESWEDDARVREFLALARAFANLPNTGAKLSWVGHVYTRAAAGVVKIERVLNAKSPEQTVEPMSTVEKAWRVLDMALNPLTRPDQAAIEAAKFIITTDTNTV